MCNMNAISVLVQKLRPRLSFLKKNVKSQGHRVKTFGTNRKVLPQGTYTCNMKALLFFIQKLQPRLRFFFPHKEYITVI